MGHRRFLPSNHRWRNSRLHNGKLEKDLAPKEYSGHDILKQLDMLGEYKPGKHSNDKDRNRKRKPVELNWTKKSIFFELEYWSFLKLHHNLNVMHIEKNICESLVGTLLDIAGKTKDNVKVRLDLQNMNIKKELHPIHEGNKLLKPHACYTLTSDERIKFCQFLKPVKFPDGYAFNIAKCVSVNDGKLSGLKSHDFHVLLEQRLLIGIRPYLPKEVCTTVLELCNFFLAIVCKDNYCS